MKTIYTTRLFLWAFLSLFLLFTVTSFAQNKEWVFLKGETSANGIGLYGTKGQEATNNIPGTRQGAITWKDNNGNLWLFGGEGYASTATKGYMNDLWMFNINTRNWVWVSGDKTVNVSGVYGTKKTAAAANKPGGRHYANGFKDASGNLYVFGGLGYNSGTTVGMLNDLWKFDMTTKQWTWMSGEDAINKTGTYGTKNTAAAANQPGCRRQAGGTTDKDGNFWLFGGQAYPATGTSNAPIGDLWKYTVSTGMWTWISGDNTLFVGGVYGTKGTAAAANKPGGRTQMSIWTDGGTNLFLFGGYYNGRLNDVWKFNTTTAQWT